ncbi:high affinity immunoglobulin epsilon receptor subunit gamma [Suncus etruscus]|uniref:high affinity immunoglobulin epsilon receptor subunit gamma n=1 Tax=Suncus etruscus TaxID=109475 RepID=UPI00210F9EB1|nr:high affinity immunoglobulin epsilon receptor subunit gamma [Suncus etruscus]
MVACTACHTVFSHSESQAVCPGPVRAHPFSLCWPFREPPGLSAGRRRGRGGGVGGGVTGRGCSVVREPREGDSCSKPPLLLLVRSLAPTLPKMRPTGLLLVLLLVDMAEALAEPQLCYILDAILFVYGLVLTLLYCRLKIQVRNAAALRENSESVYTDLKNQNRLETYETLKHGKSSK